jgi:HSP20 family protein
MNMSLVPWNPFREMDNWGREIANYMENMPFGFLSRTTSPRVDVYETDKDVVVKAEIPGVSKEDLNIFCDENSIRLSGQTRRDEEYTDENTHRSERFYGSFSRIVPLPAEVKTEQAKASYKDGILSITVPKMETSKMKGRKIDIR